MPSRSLPNLLLQAFFDLGEDGWKDEMDLNLLKLSVLSQAGTSGKFAAEPGAPANGDVIVLDETHATHPNAVAVRDAGAWVYFAPLEGWLIYDRATDAYLTFNGVAWAALATGGGGAAIAVSTEVGAYGLVLADANNYKLIDSSGGACNVTVPTNATQAFPVGTRIYIEQDHANTVTIVAAGGVTINSRGAVYNLAGNHAVAVLFKKAANLWTLSGDLA